MHLDHLALTCAHLTQGTQWAKERMGNWIARAPDHALPVGAGRQGVGGRVLADCAPKTPVRRACPTRERSIRTPRNAVVNEG